MTRTKPRNTHKGNDLCQGYYRKIERLEIMPNFLLAIYVKSTWLFSFQKFGFAKLAIAKRLPDIMTKFFYFL